eukprot:TRINITY_DN807_c0_g1_i12.p1 TRINITY_DN807_c0_g1~~TRINITY_DN807_c0_g1_i12.p1  ORF type:complete len:148 (-),score=25.88 TRINITY_DN807_c0_g1_i12:2303-2746(-)
MDRSLKRSARFPRLDPSPPPFSSNQNHHHYVLNSNPRRKPAALSGMDPIRPLRRISTVKQSPMPRNRNGAGHFYLKLAVHNRLLKKPLGDQDNQRPQRIHRFSEIVAQCYGQTSEGRRRCSGSSSPLLYTPCEPRKKNRFEKRVLSK